MFWVANFLLLFDCVLDKSNLWNYSYFRKSGENILKIMSLFMNILQLIDYIIFGQISYTEVLAA